MTATTCFTKRRRPFCLLAILTLLLTSVSPAFALNTPGGDDPPKRKSFTMSPAKLVQGKEYEVTVRSPDCGLENASLVAPKGSGITNLGKLPKSSDCDLSAKLSIDPNAPLGKGLLWLEEKINDEDRIIGTIEFEITSISPGPIPPGMNPEVDVMWGVMPRKIVRDNFGHDIATDFYGVQLVIGNNSGFDLQIAGVGFKLKDLTNKVPTNSYRSTRGVLEREQEFGRRSIILNSLKAAGLLFTGILPFWKVPNRKANAATVSDLVNGSLTAGFELIVPDTTVKQLVRLDDQMLRDGLIVKNNSQVRTLIFVPKKLLNLSRDSGKTDQGNPRKDDASVRDWKDDPQYVNIKLGELVLVGQTIAYINRVQVVANSEGGPITPPPTVTGTDIQSIEQGATREITFSGVNLQNAVVTGPDGISIPREDIRVDENGTSFRAKVTVDEKVNPGEYTLIITTKGGQFSKTIKITPATPSQRY
ncbi:MAG: hypothetical protein L0229_15535 [Blastocatellia bacterium]|nr:hypothetical protein [Blastocatellia bacterium]